MTIPYDPKPTPSPESDLYERLRSIERRLDSLTTAIDRGDTWQSWIPVYSLVTLGGTSPIQYAFTPGGYLNQDVLEVHAPMTYTSGGGHTVRLRTTDGLYTLTSPSRTTTGTHRLRWLHPYQTHPYDERYQPGSTTVLRLAPPPFFSLDFTGSGTNAWLGWIPSSRAASSDILTDGTTAGVWAYV